MRFRATAVAVIALGVALIVASIAMVLLLRRSLTADVRTSARLRAEAVARTISRGPIDPTVQVGNEEEEFVQVLDGRGEVVAASANLVGRPRLVRLRPGESRRLDELSFEDEPFLAVAARAGSGSGRVTIIAGRTLETVAESTQAIVGLLVVGVPALLLVVAAVMWRLAGRALAPVEAIRSEAEAISSKELHRRVPDSAGNDEIARLARTMNGMLARLQRAQTRQRRFVSDASHELRSPVATIRQHAEVALAHPATTEVTELAEVVLEEDVRLGGLVEDLLLLTRLDEGTPPRLHEPVDLDDLVFEEAARLRAAGDLRVDTTAVSAGRVAGDAAALRRVVRNLADNAARHARSRVAFSLRRDRATVHLAVDDDGTGIPVGDRERVFERFVRLDEARARDGGGAGLGLAIVREVVRAAGGTSRIGVSPLGGARVEVAMPAVGDPDGRALQRRFRTPVAGSG